MNTLSKRDHWLIRSFPIDNPKRRLFCFPYAGAGASVFSDWSQELSPLMPGVDVVAIQTPGHEARVSEPAVRDLSELVDRLVNVLSPVLDLPFEFFGHSLGALISFEVARTLRRRNLPQPERLTVSGRRAPQILAEGPAIHVLSENDFVTELQRRYNAIPEAVLQDQHLLSLFLPTLMADMEMTEKYQYQAESPLGIPIHVYGGHSDGDTCSENLNAWQLETTFPVTTRMFTGGHFFLESARQDVLSALSEAFPPANAHLAQQAN